MQFGIQIVPGPREPQQFAGTTNWTLLLLIKGRRAAILDYPSVSCRAAKIIKLANEAETTKDPARRAAATQGGRNHESLELLDCTLVLVTETQKKEPRIRTD